MSVCLSVCLSPSHAIFFEASHWSSDHMTRSRPLIGQPPFPTIWWWWWWWWCRGLWPLSEVFFCVWCFLCSVVILVTFSSNINNFKKNQKMQKDPEKPEKLEFKKKIIRKKKNMKNTTTTKIITRTIWKKNLKIWKKSKKFDFHVSSKNHLKKKKLGDLCLTRAL